MKLRKILAVFLMLLILLMNIGIATSEELESVAENIDNVENVIFLSLSSTPSAPQIVRISELVPIQQILPLPKFRQIESVVNSIIYLMTNNFGSRLVLVCDPSVRVSIFQSQDICKPFNYFT